MPADTAGVEVGVKDAKMGQEGAWTADVSFTDVRVPDGALIGGSEDIGYRAAMTSLARGRVHIAALAVGIAQRALDESVAYAATATQGGTPIGSFQLVQAMLADQQTGVLAGRALVRDTARLWITGEDRRIAPSAAKLFCTEMAGKVADLAVQIHGGSGYMREVPVERIYRDVRLLRLVRGHQRNPAADHRIESGQGGAEGSTQDMSGRLAGKVAFITGAARGQGRAHAVRMANEGADIIAVDIAGKLPSCVPYDSGDSRRSRRNRATRRGHGPPDPRRRSSTSAIPTGCARPSTTAWPHSGRLDIIVANAGVSAPQTWDDITPEDFRDVMDINVTGTWNTVMAGAQKIIDGGRGGSIILISSAAGIKMQPFMVHYTASKHAVTGMARAFAAELGRHSIRVNSVHPGPVNTAMGSGDMVGCVGPAPSRPIRSWPRCSHRSCPPGLPSPRTSPTRCAGWPATSRNMSPRQRSRSIRARRSTESARGGPTREQTQMSRTRRGLGAFASSQPMNRTIDSATAAGLSEPSISTVVVRVACTAPSSWSTLAISARARILAPTLTGVMKRTLL